VTEHTDVGAYALGVLEADDRRAFEAHLTGCEVCAAELADLSGMRELLAGLRPSEERHRAAAEQGDDVAGLFRRRRQTARRRRRGTLILAIAAGVVLLAGGIAVGAAAGRHRADVPADLLGWGEVHRGSDRRTGARGALALENKGWGTHVAIDVWHIKGPLTCELIAVTRSGERRPVTGWSVPPAGYGLPGAPGHLHLHGGTSVRRSQLARFEVLVERGGKLLSIPV
jgi:Putative zinc-finger